jgi:UDP-N-acetylglucosamine 2-epimerase (non-hydrolysing)
MSIAKNSMKIAIILGTRPEIIKLSPVIRELTRRSRDFFIIHSNQHYSEGMDRIFFEELNLPQPAYNLHVHDLSQSAMVGQMLLGMEPIVMQEKPDWILVQGDTNTVMAGAIVASKLGIKLGHVEAGLRSYDRAMPEEINRIVTDHLADALFCPTQTSATIALKEGIANERIFVVGNTIVEAVTQNLVLAQQSASVSKYKQQNYLLLTLHRPSNVDTESALSQAISSVEAVSDMLQAMVIYPVHPRTAMALKRFNIVPNPDKIRCIEPVGYLEMLLLMESAKLIITDSGGIQEEACIMHVPCITMRNNTERPETVAAGANMVVGTTQSSVIAGATAMIAKPRNWSNPFGEGNAAQKIISALDEV